MDRNHPWSVFGIFWGPAVTGGSPADEKKYAIYIATAPGSYAMLNGLMTLEQVNEKYWRINRPLEMYYLQMKRENGVAVTSSRKDPDKNWLFILADNMSMLQILLLLVFLVYNIMIGYKEKMSYTRSFGLMWANKEEVLLILK